MITRYDKYYKYLKKHEELYKTNVGDAWKYKTLLVFHYLDRDPQEYEISTQFVKIYRPDKVTDDQDNIIYNDIEEFYKDYDLYPQKDIRPLILEVVDSSNREQEILNDLS